MESACRVPHHQKPDNVRQECVAFRCGKQEPDYQHGSQNCLFHIDVVFVVCSRQPVRRASSRFQSREISFEGREAVNQCLNHNTARNVARPVSYIVVYPLKDNLKAMLSTLGFTSNLVNVSVVTACSRLTSRPL